MLCALHEGLQALGYLYGLADDAFDGILELGRMGRLAEEADFSLLQVLLQGTIATSTMRIKQIACSRMAVPDGFRYLPVAVGCATDVG